MREPAILREQAAELRRAAQTTREAERQRVFPMLADHCERTATKIESGAAAGQSTDTDAA
jgi:hypothetical protein